MKKTLLSLGLALLSSVAFAQNSVIYKADALIGKQEFQQASDELKAALSNPKTTKHAEIYNKLGECNAQLFNYHLMRASQGMPFDTVQFVDKLDTMVWAYTQSNKYDTTPDAKGRVKPQFVQSNHFRLVNMVDYYNYAAMFLYQNGKIADAAEYFGRYLDFPKNPIFSQHETDSIYATRPQAYAQTRVNLVQLYYQLHDWDNVITWADRALSDTLNVRDLYYMKMQAYVEKGDSATWLAVLTDGVRRLGDPGMAQNLLYYYYQRNDAAAAERMADELVAEDAQSKTAWYMKGCVALNLKRDYEAARSSFEKALAIDPDYADANNNIAATYINQVIAERMAGKFKFVGTGKSITAAQKPAYEKELAYVKGFYEKALPYMEKVRALVPERPQAWAYTLQMIYENLQMKDRKAEIDGIIESISK